MVMPVTQTLDSETLAKVRREEARRAGEVIGVGTLH